jgi:succinate dehydrogenase / fumarate reductase, cytochrome b subunit
MELRVNISLTSVQPARTVPRVVIDSRTRPTGAALTLWRSTIGKKAVMAVTGLIMVLFLLLHMLGDLKIFFGPSDFDAYASWLRTIGEPVLRGVWFLWIQRAVLLVSVVLHVVCAAQLSKRDRSARPTPYTHRPRARASFATHTMRWGGVIIALFIVWHLLDLTAGVTNPDFESGRPYHNVVVDFQVWWINLIYIVGVLMVGLHINHGFWSATQTLGVNRGSRDIAIRVTGTAVAVTITAGFLAVPIGVMTGLVR